MRTSLFWKLSGVSKIEQSWAELSQVEPSWAELSQVEPSLYKKDGKQKRGYDIFYSQK